MKKIDIDDAVFKKTPKQIQELDDVPYRLTKVKEKRSETHVRAGKTISGDLEVVNVEGDPALKVGRGFEYIRTSPIVEVIEQTKDGLTVETEGGVYKLEKLNVKN